MFYIMLRLSNNSFLVEFSSLRKFTTHTYAVLSGASIYWHIFANFLILPLSLADNLYLVSKDVDSEQKGLMNAKESIAILVIPIPTVIFEIARILLPGKSRRKIIKKKCETLIKDI